MAKKSKNSTGLSRNTKTTWNELKKIAIFTIIIGILILLSAPVLVFLKSRYKITKSDNTKEEITEEDSKDIF